GRRVEHVKLEDLKTVLLNPLDRYEDRGTILYNLACAEAQLGETDAGIEHLAAAIAERPDLAENAGEDSALDPIRAPPRSPSWARWSRIRRWGFPSSSTSRT